MTKVLFSCLLLPAFLLAGPVTAQPVSEPAPEEAELEGKDFDEADLEEEFLLLEEAATVTSASRHEQAITLSPSAITAFTRQQIACSGALSIPDLLRRVPGLQGIVASPLFTGLSGRLPYTYENNQLLVLIDGRQANLELLGQPPWELQPIEIEDIERIEVIRGPGSALYGANAFAGVVSIFTRTLPEQSGAWVTVSGAEFDRWRASGRASFRRGDWAASLAAGFDRAGNFASPRTLGKRVWKARFLGQWTPQPGRRLSLDAGIVKGDGPVPTGAGLVQGSLRQASVQLTYQDRSMNGHLYYVNNFFDGIPTPPLAYAGLELAEFKRIRIGTHTLDGELQVSLPRWWEPLMLITGARGRLAWLGCPDCLEPGFSDPTSTHYHQPGQDYFEARGGAFVHAELGLLENLVLTASGRLDYNTATGLFFSPRLAVVWRPGGEHYLRLGAARAFRKPSFLERAFHLDVTFPPTSPLQGADQMTFREFMSRVVGNEQLGNETLWAFELGYRAELGQWQLDLELYANLYGNISAMLPEIILDSRGLPDLYLSSFRFEKMDSDQLILGAELSLGWRPLDWLNLEAGLATQGVWSDDLSHQFDDTPKWSGFAGAEFRHPSGWLGSLFLFYRAAFMEHSVENPAGLLEPYLEMKVPASLLLQGRLGWQADFSDLLLEAGSKFLVPCSLEPFSWRAWDHAGGFTPEGIQFGGSTLAPTLLLYLQAEL